MDILEKLANLSRKRVKESKQELPLEELKEQAGQLQNRANRFREALEGEDISFICELKKASPSKGVIVEDFNYLKFLDDYSKGGASAISCLTEPEYFLGSLDILKDVTSHTDLPVLRKDFIVDEYQIYEAALAGASAVLLICAILDDSELSHFIKLSKSLNLDQLVEVHDLDELERAIRAGAEIIGINNRNLRDFSVDLNTTKLVSSNIPKNTLLVSESGIKNSEDVSFLKSCGADAVLIGEQLMRSRDITKELKSLKSGEKS